MEAQTSSVDLLLHIGQTDLDPYWPRLLESGTGTWSCYSKRGLSLPALKSRGRRLSDFVLGESGVNITFQ